VAKDDQTREAAHDKAARSLRIYEYVDQNGVVFWSLAKLQMISVRRLELEDVRGVHFRRHISDVERMAFQREILEVGE